MKRVMLWLSVSFACGIAAFVCTGVSALCLYGCFSAFLIFCMIKKEYKLVTLCTAAALAGCLVMMLSVARLDKSTLPLDTLTADIKGRVINVYIGKDYSYADIKTSEIYADNALYGKKQKIRVYLSEGTALKYGDTVELCAQLRRPSQGSRLAMHSKGIGLTASVSPDKITVTGNTVNRFNPFDCAMLIRNFISDKINTYLSGNSAALLSGLITGDCAAMDSTCENFFRMCGLSHITAVSGMHVGIIVSVAMSILGIFFLQKRRGSVIFYIILIWFFVLIAGFGASAIRSAVMTTLMFTAFLLRRDNDPLTSLSVSALIMLAVNPATLFDIGFQLSVLASCGIIVFYPLLQKKLGFFPSVLGNLIAVTISAQLFTLPVMVFHFGTVPLLSIFANLIICPLVPLVMTLGILLVILSGIAPVAFAIAFVLKYLLQGIIVIAAIISSAPFAATSLRFGYVLFFGYAAFCAALYFLLCLKVRIALFPAAAAAVLAAVCICTSVFGTGATLTFLNVGSGDCAVLRAPRVNVMIDSGGSFDSNVGREKVLPFLRRCGISKIDAAFLTHPHLDHGQGFITLLKNSMIKNIILPVSARGTELGDELIHTAQLCGANVYYAAGGETFSFCNVTITTVNTSDGDDENNGMVYYMTYGKKRICFTGDITKNAERNLCKTQRNVSCDLLKIAHHGSQTSSDIEFLRASSAKFAVISCAGEQKPAPETVDSLEKEGINYAITKVNGNIEFKLNLNRFTGICLERGNINEL